ncbi:pentapeptide repeat-containing protein [Streptomyces sp. NPDC058385]|uniref:pentapeptide repeat-containing protein n=1 Tax=Streptomyces sp. NPDC058385 TaxID=3346473 RepID=UPI0036487C0B
MYRSYLRMPFSPDPPTGPAEEELHSFAPLEQRAAKDALQTAVAAWEQVVRITVQRILTRHLFVGADKGPDPAWPLHLASREPKFRPGIELDLTGAVLLNFEFTGRRGENATFDSCRFVGGANFAHCEFIQHVYFKDARFERGAGHFLGAWFGLRAVFHGTDFGEKPAVFDGATFTGMTFFQEIALRSASFNAARALVDFDENWGSVRHWPSGWRERALEPGDSMPLLPEKLSRWPASNLPPGCGAWNVLVAESQGP